MARTRRDPGFHLTNAVMIFYFSAFILLALRDLRWEPLAMAFAVPLIIWAGSNLLNRLFPVDALLMTLTNFLCGLSILILWSTDPARCLNQCLFYGLGLIGMIVCICLVRMIRRWTGLLCLVMPLGIVFIILPLLFGRETNGALNWIYIGGLSIQPSELLKPVLLLVIACFMSRRLLLPWLLFAITCLAVLMLQSDLGTALIYYGTVLLVYFAASGNLILTSLGLLGGTGAAWFGYVRFAHVRRRVAIWRNPWSDYGNAGYQIVQSLIAIASGGLFGVGLGLGSPTIIPVYYTDFIFSVICEQFGVIFGLCVIAIYVAIAWRGAVTAMAARHSFHGLLALGCTVMLSLQTFTIIGGVIKLIPLTGVTLPFVSYGGSSMVSAMCIMGLLQGVCSLNVRDLDEDARLAGREEDAE